MITPISRRQHFTKFERHNVDRWGDKSLLSGQKFDNFTLRGRFFPKNAKIPRQFPGLATSGRHNSAIITDRPKLTTKISLYGLRDVKFPFLPLESIQNHSSAPQTAYKKGTYPRFRNVRCPILRKYAAVRSGGQTWDKSRPELQTENK